MLITGFSPLKYKSLPYKTSIVTFQWGRIKITWTNVYSTLFSYLLSSLSAVHDYAIR